MKSGSHNPTSSFSLPSTAINQSLNNCVISPTCLFKWIAVLCKVQNVIDSLLTCHHLSVNVGTVSIMTLVVHTHSLPTVHSAIMYTRISELYLPFHSRLINPYPRSQKHITALSKERQSPQQKTPSWILYYKTCLVCLVFNSIITCHNCTNNFTWKKHQKL